MTSGVTVGITRQSGRLWVRFDDEPDDAAKATLRAVGLSYYPARGRTYRLVGRWMTPNDAIPSSVVLAAVYQLTGIAPRDERERAIARSVDALERLSAWLPSQPPDALSSARAWTCHRVREEWACAIAAHPSRPVTRDLLETMVLEWAERLMSVAPSIYNGVRQDAHVRWSGASRKLRRLNAALAVVDAMLAECGGGDALAMLTGDWQIREDGDA